MTPHIPKQPNMKLCKDCEYCEKAGPNAPGWSPRTGQALVCTAVANAVTGIPVDAVSARTGQFCGLSGALYLKRVKS